MNNELILTEAQLGLPQTELFDLLATAKSQGQTVGLNQLETIVDTARANGWILEISEFKTLLQVASAEHTGSLSGYFSGPLSNGVIARDLFYDHVVPQGGDLTYTIDNIAATELLINRNFELLFDAKAEALGLSVDAKKAILNGEFDPVTQTRIPGFWDIVSENMAKSSIGDAFSISPNANWEGSWGQVELPALLDNVNIERINGLIREDLVRLSDALISDGMDAVDAYRVVFDRVNLESRSLVASLDIGAPGAGNYFEVGADKFYDRLGFPELGNPLSSDYLVSGRSSGEARFLLGIDSTSLEALRRADIANNYLEQYSLERMALAQANSDIAAIDSATRSMESIGRMTSWLNDALTISEQHANGKVTTLAGLMDSPTEWAKTNLTQLLADSTINTIDGVDRGLLASARDTLIQEGFTETTAVEAVGNMLAEVSRNQLAEVSARVNANGEIVAIDVAKLVGDTAQPIAEIPGETTSLTTVRSANTPLTSMLVDSINRSGDAFQFLTKSPEFWASVKNYDATFASGMDAAGKWLGRAGGALMALSAVYVGNQALDDFKNGDPVAGTEKIRDWSFGAIGGMLAGGIALQGAGLLLAPVAAVLAAAGFGATAVGIGVAGAIGLSLTAAYYGAEAFIEGGKKLTEAVAELLGYFPSLSSGIANTFLSLLSPVFLVKEIGNSIANLFTSATVATAPVRRDPLTFDLDNDGLETTGIDTANPLYFDHNADGVKTATGWVSADDAFLVLDKNANGTIDNGRELFGDAFIKSNGQPAADGFDALRDLDSNGDGMVDASDVQFANLRLWRDLNQDGVSQANELFTLDSQNIAAIHTGSSEHSQILANGNQLADTGTFIKTDGSSGTLGEVTGHLGDIDLVQDTFHSQFADTLDTTGFETLPDMQGAGQVRSLREAATLSPVLAQLLTDFAAADRTGQQALLDAIIKAWSDTSPMAATFTGAYDGHSLSVNMQNLAASSDAYTALAGKLTILEHFNGRTFNAVPDGTTAATVNLWTILERFNGRTFNTVPVGTAANDKTWGMAA